MRKLGGSWTRGFRALMAKRRKGMDSSAAEPLRYTYLALFLTHMLHKADYEWFKKKHACFISLQLHIK